MAVSRARDIAVANKYFGILPDQLIIQQVQDPDGTIATTHTPDAIHILVG